MFFHAVTRLFTVKVVGCMYLFEITYLGHYSKDIIFLASSVEHKKIFICMGFVCLYTKALYYSVIGFRKK